MKKTILPLIILSTLLSCSRESKFKSVDISDFKAHSEMLNDSEEASHNDISSKFPLLQIHPKSSTLKILNTKEELVKEVELKVTHTPFVRKKLLNIIKDKYSDSVSIDDLFKFNFSISPSDSFKIINKYKFSDLNNLRGVISIISYLKYEDNGLLLDLSYRSGVENLPDSFSESNLENSYGQTEGFEFGAKPNEAYEFKISSLLLKELFKNILKDNGIIFSLVDFSLEDENINQWKSKVLERGSILIISEEDSQKNLFIPHKVSVKEVLEKNNIDINTLTSHKKVNFNKMSEQINRGEVLALVRIKSEYERSEKVYSEYQNVKEIKFTKVKNKNAHLYIQLNGIKHSIFHWYQPQKIRSLRNGKGFISRECNVSRRKVNKNSVDLIPKKEKSSFTLSYNGISKNISSLIKSGDIKIEANDNSLHITLMNLPGGNDHSEVTFLINSTLSLKDIIQDKGQCVLRYSSREIDVAGAFETLVKEEVFEHFKPSSRKELVGVEKSMNILTVL